jgi:hypothetical protein
MIHAKTLERYQYFKGLAVQIQKKFLPVKGISGARRIMGCLFS